MHTRAHTAALTRPIAAALGAVAILAFVVAVLARTGRPGFGGQVAAFTTSALAIWALVRLVREVWAWDRTMLLVSEEEIVTLRAIHRLRVRRSLFGRLLGYGTIELAGANKGSRLKFVPQPDEVSAVISTYAGRHDHVR